MDDEQLASWRESLRRLLASLSDDYDIARDETSKLSRAFHAELATAFASRLNARLQELPRANVDECRKVANFCNTELRRLHLCIRCPKTSAGAILVVDDHGRGRNAPRFRIQARGSRGHVTRSYTSLTIPALDVMEDCHDVSVAERQSRGR